MKWGFPISISLLFWLFIRILRNFEEKFLKEDQEIILFITEKYKKVQLSRVAVCISAKNEAKGIRRTINSIKKNTSLEHCYVISDGSNDKTAEIAEKAGCKVVVNKRSTGKARALKKLIRENSLIKKYDFILFVDADTQLDKNYIKKALFLFENEKVVAIAGYAVSEWRNPKKINIRNFIAAYRTRLYSSLQFFYFYGQTWKRTNVSSIIPGFASMYRTSILKKIDMAIPEMAIEDFNWTFQVRKKKLGLVAHHPSIRATAQDPTTLVDYIRQVERWNIGFFQAIKYNGVWLSFFWFFLSIFMLEVFLTAIFFGLFPLIVLSLAFTQFSGLIDQTFVDVGNNIETFYTVWGIIFGVYIIDYFLTVFIAIKDKKPMLLIYGLGFIFLRFIDAFMLIGVAERFLFLKSEGIWVSPKRK